MIGETILETILEIVVGFLLDIVWHKLFRPFFYYTGIAFRRLLNLFRKTKPDPHKRKHNTFIGILIWLIGVVAFFVVRNN
jgi:hypothetical protein